MILWVILNSAKMMLRDSETSLVINLVIGIKTVFFQNFWFYMVRGNKKRLWIIRFVSHMALWLVTTSRELVGSYEPFLCKIVRAVNATLKVKFIHMPSVEVLQSNGEEYSEKYNLSWFGMLWMEPIWFLSQNRGKFQLAIPLNIFAT